MRRLWNIKDENKLTSNVQMLGNVLSICNDHLLTHETTVKICKNRWISVIPNVVIVLHVVDGLNVAFEIDPRIKLNAAEITLE